MQLMRTLWPEPHRILSLYIPYGQCGSIFAGSVCMVTLKNVATVNNGNLGNGSHSLVTGTEAHGRAPGHHTCVAAWSSPVWTLQSDYNTLSMVQWITTLSLPFMPLVSLDQSLISAQIIPTCPSRLSSPEPSPSGPEVAQMSHWPQWGVVTCVHACVCRSVVLWEAGAEASTFSPSHSTWHTAGRFRKQLIRGWQTEWI